MLKKKKEKQKQKCSLFLFPTVFPQGFQLETNHCSCRVSPRRGKALAQEILFKVQVAGLKLGSTPSQAQYEHFETKSPTNLANPLGLKQNKNVVTLL